MLGQVEDRRVAFAGRVGRRGVRASCGRARRGGGKGIAQEIAAALLAFREDPRDAVARSMNAFRCFAQPS